MRQAVPRDEMFVALVAHEGAHPVVHARRVLAQILVAVEDLAAHFTLGLELLESARVRDAHVFGVVEHVGEGDAAPRARAPGVGIQLQVEAHAHVHVLQEAKVEHQLFPATDLLLGYEVNLLLLGETDQVTLADVEGRPNVSVKYTNTGLIYLYYNRTVYGLSEYICKNHKHRTDIFILTD
jgi:hypothetical protein